MKLARRSMLALTALLFCASACEKEEPLPEYGAVGDFQLTNQKGESFGAGDLRGKTWVAAFMFTRCPTICPRLTAKLREVRDLAAKQEVGLQLVSFSVDPENDTPEVLRAYAKKNGADSANWTYLTGDYEVIKKSSVQGFKMHLEGKADPDKDHFGILHGSYLVLVDGKGHIRGYYRSGDEDVVERLVRDAGRLD